jgi:hypothetical protein
VTALASEIEARRGRKPEPVMPHLVSTDVDASGRKVYTLALPGDAEHPGTSGTAPKATKRVIWSPSAQGGDRIKIVEQ